MYCFEVKYSHFMFIILYNFILYCFENLFCVMCGRTVLIIWNDDSIPLCCTCLAVNFFVDHSLILTESCLSSYLTFHGICCKIFVYEFRAVFTFKVSMSRFDFCLTTSNIKVSSTIPFVNCKSFT